MWKDIKGYEGKYQVSHLGEIKRIYPSGKERLLKPYLKATGRRHVYLVKLTKDGETKQYVFAQLVAKTFKGEIPKGLCVVHKNGLQSDNRVENLIYADKTYLGEKFGADSRRMVVAKIDKSGNIVCWYKSAREAGRENFMSYQTIIDRCNGKVKSEYAPDGYKYMWDKDIKY